MEHSPASSPVPADATRLTPGIRVKGELSGRADLYIDGEVEGHIHLGQSAVTVGPKGRVKADIEARQIVVQGSVEGDLNGHERVLLGRTSNVNGELETPRLVIEDGARFCGSVNMVPAEEARASRGAPAEAGALRPVSVRAEKGLQ